MSKNTKRQNKNKLIILLFVVAFLFFAAAVGLLLQGSFSKNAFQPTSSIDGKTSIDVCLEKIDENHPNPPGLSDHRDKSECYSHIVFYASLSDIEKETGKKNDQIRARAIAEQNRAKCNEIKGNIYIPYPPNLDKVMITSESGARAMCLHLVERAIEKAEKG